MANIYLIGNKSNDFMDNAILIENKEGVTRKEAFSFSWKASPSTQHLLDAISSIIAREFIMIAKQNPTVFSEIASPPSGVRNDKL